MTSFDLKKEIDEIKARNKRVEADKAWETSWTRRLLILLLTYIVIVIFFFVAKLPEPFANAVVPSVAFLLSTMTVPLFKQWWLTNRSNSMGKEILIVKNNTHECPGLFEELLKERAIKYTIIDLDQGQNFPPIENYRAVIVLGGPDSANDENKKMRSELSKIQEILSAKIPYLGICLGLQSLVKAAGGKVIKSPTKEVGFRGPDGNLFTVKLTEVGKEDSLFEGLEDTLHVFHLHGETVELTDEMSLLAMGQFCQNQIVKVGSNAYGMQCHFELTQEMFETWMNEDADLPKIKNLKRDFENTREKYIQIGRQLFQNFLKITGF